MRRVLAFLTLTIVASACATPEIRLSLQFPDGQTRLYRIQTRATTRYDVSGLHETETTTLTSLARIHVAAKDGATQIRITVTPSAFTRNGRRGEPPAPQDATMTVDANGVVSDLTAVGRASLPLAGSADDLGALLGAPVRDGVIHVGDRWESKTAKGTAVARRSSRVAGLRYVGGYPCSIIVTATVRPVSRSAQTASGNLSLSGTETSATQTAFAYERGFPVSIEAHARSLLAEPSSNGTVVITSATTLTLVPPSAGTSSESPAPTPAPTRAKSSQPAKKATVKATVKATPSRRSSGSPAR